jgi:hypothetical protein
VLAAPVNHQVRTTGGRKATVAALARLVPARCWETRSCGRGCKGHRDYEWALVATSSPRHWLLIRRKISDPADLAFFYAHAPGLVSLSILIKVAGKRWRWRSASSRGKGRPAFDLGGKLPARPDEQPPQDTGLIRVTVPEARRPLAASARGTFRCAWSIWRRRHQARARWHHYQAQLQPAPA